MMTDWLICDVECAVRVKLPFSKWQLNYYLIESKLSLNHQNKQDYSKYFHTRDNDSPVLLNCPSKPCWLFLTKTVTRDRVITKYKRIYFITGVLKTFSDRFISYEKKILESFVLKACCVIQTRLLKMYIFFLNVILNKRPQLSLANKMVAWISAVSPLAKSRERHSNRRRRLKFSLIKWWRVKSENNFMRFLSKFLWFLFELKKREWNHFLTSRLYHLITFNIMGDKLCSCTIVSHWLVCCIEKFHVQRCHGSFAISHVKML